MKGHLLLKTETQLSPGLDVKVIQSSTEQKHYEHLDIIACQRSHGKMKVPSQGQMKVMR